MLRFLAVAAPLLALCEHCDLPGAACEAEEDLTAHLQLGARKPAPLASQQTPENDRMDDEKVKAEVKKHKPMRVMHAPAGASTGSCRVGGGEDCALSGLTGITKIYPGGRTRCLNNSNSEYFFQVYPGDTKRLYFHFQGGGACWNDLTFTFGECSQMAYEEGEGGFFNSSNPRNPYAKWTKIVVQYCSGDMHAGDTEQEWGGSTVQVRGAVNARSAVNYALANFPKLTDFTLGGCSAGSLGVQVWSYAIFNEFAGRNAHMVALGDSFLGALYPPWQIGNVENGLINIWNLCNSGILTGEMKAQCNAGEFRLVDAYMAAMRRFPEANFANIQSKADSTQANFTRFAMLTVARSIVGYTMTDAQFYQTANILLQELAQFDNYNVFLINGQDHCFTQQERLFQATPSQPAETDDIRPKLVNWLRRVQAAERTSYNNICFGEEKTVTRFVPIASTTYCDRALQPFYRNASQT